MRKANKILMSAVAILLCLVLISTSVVSGVFARFVVKRSAETSVGFTNFGVTVKMTVDEKLKSLVGNGNYAETVTGDSASITLSNLTMYPGTTFPEAVKVEVNGTAGTNLKVKVYADLIYTRAEFSIEATKLNELLGISKTNPEAFVPIGLLLNMPVYQTTDGSVSARNVNSPWRDVTQEGAEKTFAQSVGRYTDLKYIDAKSGATPRYYAYKDFSANDPIVFYPDNSTEANGAYQNYQVDTTNPFTTFHLGYMWPIEYSSRGYTKAQINTIETWLMKDRTPSYSVVFTVEVEQTFD